MAMKVSKMIVWVGTIKDEPGGLAEKLTIMADAGAQLEYVLARRTPEKKGKGVVFLAPLRGAKQLAAAKKAKLRKSKSIHAIRVEGGDKPGLGAKVTQALGDKGISFRGLAAVVIGKRFVVHLALDSAGAASKALRVLKALR